MGLSSLSLVLASVVAVVAQPALAMSIFGPGKTATSDEVESSTKTSDGVSPTPSGVFFKSNWTIPRIALNESTTLMYSIEESIDQRRPQLVLCQTSATGSPSISVSPDNSWTVTPRT